VQRKDSDGVIYYSSELLEECGVVNAISTRHGGVSAAPFDTLNLSHAVGDAQENVDENHLRLMRAVGLNRDSLVQASQAQADRWVRVDGLHRGSRVKDVDALITNERGLPMLLRFADCVPILIVDPRQHAAAIVHSGWRGTSLRILEKTVRGMQAEFGTRAQDVRAFIGPSIGPCCYIVGTEVIDRVRKAYAQADELLTSNEGHTHFDLWTANEIQLRELGVEQIETARVCTSDHTDDFYSWRAERAKTGRFAALVSLS
jgi:YfiH family protein